MQAPKHKEAPNGETIYFLSQVNKNGRKGE